MYTLLVLCVVKLSITCTCGDETRNLADQQAQAAANFREAIRHSLAIDAGDNDVSSPASSVYPQRAEAGERPCSDAAGLGCIKYTDQQLDPELGDNQTGQENLLGEEPGDVRKRSCRRDDEDSAEVSGDMHETGTEYAAAAAAAAASPAEIGKSTSGAAFVLASDLSRLASRQAGAACELLQVSPSEATRCAVSLDPWKDPRQVSEVMNTLAALGQSVGLQAKAVRLMEEVVARTVHSRVSGRDGTIAKNPGVNVLLFIRRPHCRLGTYQASHGARVLTYTSLNPVLEKTNHSSTHG